MGFGGFVLYLGHLYNHWVIVTQRQDRDTTAKIAFLGLTQTHHMWCIKHMKNSTDCGFKPVLRKSYFSV